MAVTGRPLAIETPDDFERLAMQYINWVQQNPVDKTITASFQGVISYEKVPHTRGMTQYGLAAHMKIGISTLKDYKKKPEFSAIYEYIDALMKSWNAVGSMSGDLNAALVARLDGHAETQDHTSSDGTMSPKQSINVGKLSDEQLRSFDALISQASEAGAIET